MTARRNNSLSVGQVLRAAMMLILALLTIYPFWYCLIYSFSLAQRAAQTSVVFWPAGFTLQNYRSILRIQQIYSATLISI